ncbi:MAG: carboxypeptidase regulatory-like domain-containing protein, partial [Bacteroidales bacterium]
MNTRKKINDLIKGAFTLFLIISLAGIVSCEKKDEPVPPAPLPAKYTIKGVVLNQQNNQALPGVLVTMGSLSKTTDASGNFEFKDLTTAGKYTLIFTKDDFFDATYSIEFPEAAPNHVLTLNLSVSMVPYVPGVTPIDPSTGGTINIVAETPASLTIPAGTTVTDKNDVPVTGSINITAVPTTNIVSGTLNNPGLSVLRFEPSGLKFSNPLPLTIDNPLTSVRFSSVQL